jgi:hypothetical protein
LIFCFNIWRIKALSTTRTLTTPLENLKFQNTEMISTEASGYIGASLARTGEFLDHLTPLLILAMFMLVNFWIFCGELFALLSFSYLSLLCLSVFELRPLTTHLMPTIMSWEVHQKDKAVLIKKMFYPYSNDLPPVDSTLLIWHSFCPRLLKCPVHLYLSEAYLKEQVDQCCSHPDDGYVMV